jgi:ammonium transporter, Amt family
MLQVAHVLVAQAAEVFPEQVSTDQLAQNLVYASGVVGAIIAVTGLVTLDAGSVRGANAFTSTIEKLIGFFIGVSVYFLIGFAIWNWQYNQAFEVPNALGQSISDFWLGGTFTNELAQFVDPEVFPGLNNFQIFIFFLAVFAGFINILLHYAVGEKMKASAYFITCAVATVASSFLSWATWGSVGPLTNAGYHDFFGAGFVYLFPAGMAVFFLTRLRPRPGMFKAHVKVPKYRPGYLWPLPVGVLLVFAGLPMVIMSCLFFFDPEQLAVSVTMADTSVGIALNNFAVAWAGGAITGMAIGYWKKDYAYLLLGPFAGYVAGASGLDIYEVWQMFLVALGAPIVAYAVYEFSLRRGVDEHKLFPVFLGAGTYGLLMVGLIQWGTPQGGFLGIEEGTYAFQNATVNVGWQAIGIVACLGLGILTAAVLSLVLEPTIGLRRTDEEQAEGLDRALWGLEPEYGETPILEQPPQPAVPATGGPSPHTGESPPPPPAGPR